MNTISSTRKESQIAKLSRANSRKVFRAFPTDPKAASSSSASSSSSSESSMTLETVPSSQQIIKPNHISRSSVTKPNKPAKTLSTLSIAYNNEVVVFDVNETAVLHSLIERNGVWFLDVSDLDAMDKDSTFQYMAIRSSSHNNLVLTRVPELRHLLYVKFDGEGRPYPIQMRKVSQANYLTSTAKSSFITEEETKEYYSNSSFWEALSVKLRRTIMFSEEPHNDI